MDDLCALLHRVDHPNVRASTRPSTPISRRPIRAAAIPGRPSKPSAAVCPPHVPRPQCHAGVSGSGPCAAGSSVPQRRL